MQFMMVSFLNAIYNKSTAGIVKVPNFIEEKIHSINLYDVPKVWKIKVQL